MMSAFLQLWSLIFLVGDGVYQSYILCAMYGHKEFNAVTRHLTLCINLIIYSLLLLSSIEAILEPKDAICTIFQTSSVMGINLFLVALGLKLWIALYDCIAAKKLFELNLNEVKVVKEDISKGAFGYLSKYRNVFKQKGPYLAVGYAIVMIVSHVGLLQAGYSPCSWELFMFTLIPVIPVFVLNFILIVILLCTDTAIDPLKVGRTARYGGVSAFFFVISFVILRAKIDISLSLPLSSIVTSFCLVLTVGVLLHYPLHHANKQHQIAESFVPHRKEPCKSLLDYIRIFGDQGFQCFIAYCKEECLPDVICFKRMHQWVLNVKAKTLNDSKQPSPMLSRRTNARSRNHSVEHKLTWEDLAYDAKQIYEHFFDPNAPFNVHVHPTTLAILKNCYHLLKESKLQKDNTEHRHEISTLGDIDQSSSSQTSPSDKILLLPRTTDSTADIVYVDVNTQREVPVEDMFNDAMEELSTRITKGPFSRYMVSKFRLDKKDGRLNTESTTHRSTSSSSSRYSTNSTPAFSTRPQRSASTGSQTQHEMEEIVEATPIPGVSLLLPTQPSCLPKDIVPQSPLPLDKRGEETSPEAVDETPCVEESQPPSKSSSFNSKVLPSPNAKSLNTPSPRSQNTSPSKPSSTTSSTQSSHLQAPKQSTTMARSPSPQSIPSPTSDNTKPITSQQKAPKRSPKIGQFFNFVKETLLEKTSSNFKPKPSRKKTPIQRQRGSSPLAPLLVRDPKSPFQYSSSDTPSSSLEISCGTPLDQNRVPTIIEEIDDFDSSGENQSSMRITVEPVTEEDEHLLEKVEQSYDLKENHNKNTDLNLELSQKIDSDDSNGTDAMSKSNSNSSSANSTPGSARRSLKVDMPDDLEYVIFHDVYMAQPAIGNALSEIGKLEKSRQKLLASMQSVNTRSREQRLIELTEYESEWRETEVNASQVVADLHQQNEKMERFVKEVQRLYPNQDTPVTDESLDSLKAACERLDSE